MPDHLFLGDHTAPAVRTPQLDGGIELQRSIQSLVCGQQRPRWMLRETPREFLNKESHYLWGKRYLLEIAFAEAAPTVSLTPRKLYLQVRPGADPARCEVVLDRWYRQQLHEAVPALLATWEPLVGVKASRVFVQRMKTKWGSCTPRSGYIRLNTDLAKKPPECLEYILVHELVHLLEPTHNERFSTLMDRYLPHWRHLRQRLNALPVRHERWDY